MMSLPKTMKLADDHNFDTFKEYVAALAALVEGEVGKFNRGWGTIDVCITAKFDGGTILVDVDEKGIAITTAELASSALFSPDRHHPSLDAMSEGLQKTSETILAMRNKIERLKRAEGWTFTGQVHRRTEGGGS